MRPLVAMICLASLLTLTGCVMPSGPSHEQAREALFRAVPSPEQVDQFIVPSGGAEQIPDEYIARVFEVMVETAELEDAGGGNGHARQLTTL